MVAGLRTFTKNGVVMPDAFAGKGPRVRNLLLWLQSYVASQVFDNARLIFASSHFFPEREARFLGPIPSVTENPLVTIRHIHQ
jgi:hypothetical protein